MFWLRNKKIIFWLPTLNYSLVRIPVPNLTCYWGNIGFFQIFWKVYNFMHLERYLSKKYVPTLPKVFRPVTSKAQIIIWPSLIVSFNGIKISTAHPDQMPHDVVSDQGFHCFLTDFALNI